MTNDDLIRRGMVIDRLDLAEHDAEERDWRSGANEIARLRKYVAALPAVTPQPTIAAALALPEIAAAEAAAYEQAVAVAGLMRDNADAAAVKAEAVMAERDDLRAKLNEAVETLLSSRETHVAIAAHCLEHKQMLSVSGIFADSQRARLAIDATLAKIKGADK